MKHSSTALLIVDFINFFDFDQARDIAPRAMFAARNTARLKQLALRQKVACIYVNDNFGRWTSEFSQLVEACVRKNGTAAKIATMLQPQPGDYSVLKPRHSAFYGTPLEFLLAEIGVINLVITGIAADMCVFATAQDAYVRKFKVWVPADCVASFSAARERATLRHMEVTLKAYTANARRRRRISWRAPA